MSVTKTRWIAIGKRVDHTPYHSITHLSARFSGRIPTELGHLTALIELDLRANQLTGERVPPYKPRLTVVKNGQRVYHSTAHSSAGFAGRIPTEFGQLTELIHLSLNNNQLTGECDYTSFTSPT